jgi:8-oxo-dGTP pyrophosphatase MutT (NUDIX family)
MRPAPGAESRGCNRSHYSALVELTVAVRRLAYRTAYRVLQVWWFLTRPRKSGVKCVLTDGDQVLLVRHTYGRRRWDIPGGAVKRGEPPAHAARREMREELGIDVADWVSIGEMLVRMNHRHDTLHCFHVDLRAPAIRINRGELDEAHWFARGALPAERSRYVGPILGRVGAA